MYFLSNIPEIKISPDVLFQLGPIGVTDSMMAMLVVNVFLIGLILWFRKGAGIIPSRIQVAIESLVTFFTDTMVAAFGSREEARRYFPLVFTIFLAFFVANQFSVLPILSDLHASGGDLSVFRVPTSDFSLTIAMALLVVIVANIIALRIAPIRHIGSFIKIAPFFKIRSFGDFLNACLEFFLGLLDIIGEIAKVVSLSARLFGNVFAGELMVLIITALAAFTTFIIPIPFIFLSIFSGVIQAFVFPLLAIQYLAGTIMAAKAKPETA